MVSLHGHEAGNGGNSQGRACTPPRQRSTLLHYVFDLWVQRWRTRQAQGNVVVVRYADDVVVGFEHEGDAHRFRAELGMRLGQFSLDLHTDKTRLIEFGRFAAERRARKGQGKPETFNFLGFTHICGQARSGRFLLVRHSSRRRRRAKLREVRDEIMRRRHLSIKKQGMWLARVVQGYLNYHAIHTNIHAIQQFRKQVTRHWHRALRRRSQTDRTTWARMNRLAERWLPVARIQHPWSTERFDATTRGGSPVR